MNSAYLLVTAACTFLLAYRYYSAFITTKILMLNDRNETPAYRCNDGRDFVPINKWVLFGYHFSAISGSGSLIGPVLAIQWGWGPGFMWIMLGSIFAGAVHDFIILFASVRHNGQSLTTVARREMGAVTSLSASLVIFFILITALAGMGSVAVNALHQNPRGIFALALTTPVVVGMGFCLFKISPSIMRFGPVFGGLLIMCCVAAGQWLMAEGIFFDLMPYFSWTLHELSIALPVYGFIAAVLPVWMLIVPRGYMTSSIIIGAIGLLAIGFIIAAPPVQFPFATRYINGGWTDSLRTSLALYVYNDNLWRYFRI